LFLHAFQIAQSNNWITMAAMADQLAGNVPAKWHGADFKRLRLSFLSEFESEAITDDISKIPEMVVAIEKTNYLRLYTINI
jgi:hypothetical protein